MSSSLRLELTDRGGVPPEQHQRRQRKTPRELKREQRKRHAACASSPRDALAAVETNVEAVSAASPPTDPPRTGAVVAVAGTAAMAPVTTTAVCASGVVEQGDVDRVAGDPPAKRARPGSPPDLALYQEADSMCAVDMAKLLKPPDSSREGDSCASDGDGEEGQEDSMPAFDGSIKTRCRITSTRPFDWVAKIGGAVEATAMQRFVGGAGGGRARSAGGELASSMAGTDFVEALLHWKFPAVALPPSLARAYQQLAASSVRAPSPKETPTDDKQWLQHRRIEWQTSFRSLYYAFVGGNCTEFYVVARSNRDNLFSGFVTVFSKRAATGDDDGIMAILSCTTRGLRKGLEDEAVEYDMPASGSSKASEGTKVGDPGDEEEEARQFVARADRDTVHLKSSVDIRDGTPNSLVRVRGKDNVAGLYGYLLNWMGGALDDVPTLYAACPFANAAIGRANHVQSMAPAAEAAQSAAANGGEGGAEVESRRHVLTITGILLPHSLSRLYIEMKRRQINFRVALKTEPLTCGVNMALEPADGEVPMLRNRKHVSVKVQCEGGRYSVVTSARGS